METQWKRQSSFWLLILGASALRKTQADLHSLQLQLTIMAAYGDLPDIFFNGCLDDHLILSYDSHSKDLVVKLDRVNAPMQNFLVQKNREEMMRVEAEVQRMYEDRRHYYNWTQGIHTAQALLRCETDKGILVNSLVRVAFDGEDMCQLDEEEKQWTVRKPEAEDFCPFWKDPFWIKAAQVDCPFFLSLLLQIVHMKERTPPEVTVSRHHTSEGSTTLSCLATGFYPPSILLLWKKNGRLGIWGQESSSGTLPNADATYYLHVTLKLPPGDTGEGYACVVDHSELGKPAVYPVPGETSRGSSWIMVLSAIAATLLVLSSLAAFIMWKKKKSEMTPLSQLEGVLPPLSPSTAL